jgi:endonuclease/exonuclease/phosphatase family metal-dependent hydrolase
MCLLQGVENEQRRKEHVEHLLLELQAFADSHAVKHVVLCGDFNTQPFNVPKHEAQAVPMILRDNAVSLRSAYPLPVSQEEQLFTTCKQRAGVMKVNYIDYIWHSAAIATTRTMRVPSLDDVLPTGLPCARYPSDHFSISAEMILHGFDTEVRSFLHPFLPSYLP